MKRERNRKILNKSINSENKTNQLRKPLSDKLKKNAIRVEQQQNPAILGQKQVFVKI